MNEEILNDIRRTTTLLFDEIEEHDLPMPHSFDFDATLGTVSVAWMLQEDEQGTRRVIGAFPGEWVQAMSSSTRAPIFDHKGDGFEITIWAHPDAIKVRLDLS